MIVISSLLWQKDFLTIELDINLSTSTVIINSTVIIKQTLITTVIIKPTVIIKQTLIKTVIIKPTVIIN